MASCPTGRWRRGDTKIAGLCYFQWEGSARASCLAGGENSLISTESATWGRGSPNLGSLWSCLQSSGRYLFFHYSPWLHLKWHWKMCPLDTWAFSSACLLLLRVKDLRILSPLHVQKTPHPQFYLGCSLPSCFLHLLSSLSFSHSLSGIAGGLKSIRQPWKAKFFISHSLSHFLYLRIC